MNVSLVLVVIAISSYGSLQHPTAYLVEFDALTLPAENVFLAE
jgi:hypothetical protein